LEKERQEGSAQEGGIVINSKGYKGGGVIFSTDTSKGRRADAEVFNFEKRHLSSLAEK